MKTTKTTRISAAVECLEHRLMLAGDLRYGLGLGATQVDIATDNQANAYVVGTFKGTVDFNPSPRRQWNMTAANANGDLFVARFNPTGALAWAVQLGSASGAPVPTGVSILPWGTNAGVWVCGSFEASQDFDPSAATFNMNSKGGKDMFLLGLAQNGVFKTAARAGDKSFDEVPVDVTMDGLYRIYLAGSVTLGANTEAIASQFTGTGRYVASRTWATAGVDIVPTAISADGQGDFFMAGTVTGPFTFTGGGSVSGAGAFLLKLDTTGTYEWVNEISGATIRALSTDRLASAGPYSIVAAGDFTGKIDVDPDPAVAKPLTSLGGTDAFVVKYDANGQYLWRTSMGGAGDDAAKGVDVDAGGSIYVGGLFRGTATFPRGASLVSRGGSDAFVAKYDLTGKQRYLDQFGGTGDDRIDHIAVGLGADIYAMGPLLEAGNYHPAGGTVILAPFPGHTEDTFLLRLD